MATTAASFAGTAGGLTQSISKLSPLPTPPTPFNYITWLAGIVPTVWAGLWGFWGLIAGFLGVLLMIYTILSLLTNAFRRVVGSPVINWLNSISVSIDESTSAYLDTLSTKGQKFSFVVLLLLRWIFVTIVSVPAGLLLFALGLCNDAVGLIILFLISQTLMFITAKSRTEALMGSLQWSSNIMRTFYNLSVMGFNGINEVTRRWFTQLYNTNVVGTVALALIIGRAIDIPSFAGRMLQETPATYSPTSSAQTRLTNDVPATIPGSEFVIRTMEPYFSSAAYIYSLTNTAGITLAGVGINSLGPVLPAVIDGVGFGAQVSSGAFSTVGGHCTVRDGLGMGLD